MTIAEQRTRRAVSETIGVGAAFAAAGTPDMARAQMRDDELCFLSAAELLALFKARKLSPVEVLKAQILKDVTKTWPNITAKGTPPADRDEWAKVSDKLAEHFSPNPGKGG